MKTPAMIEKCMHEVLQPLSEKETAVRDHVIAEFFMPLTQRHWEGVEVADYWKKRTSTGSKA